MASAGRTWRAARRYGESPFERRLSPMPVGSESIPDLEMVRRLTRVLGSTLRELGDAGGTEKACELATPGWVLLYKKMPSEAEYLNGILHYLTADKTRGDEHE